MKILSLKSKVIIFLIITVVGSAISFFLEEKASTHYLALFGFVLMWIIAFSMLFLNEDELMTPLTFFSISYFGYVIASFYYSANDGDYGKFMDFLNLKQEIADNYMIKAILFAIICYVFFVVGYSTVIRKKINRDVIHCQSDFLNFIFKYRLVLIGPLLLVSFLYWIWVCNLIAGGVFNALVKFQIFPHLANEYNITILPYLLYYAGINIWLLSLVDSNRRISFYFIFFSLVGFIISISTARITISVSYLLPQLILVYFFRIEYRRKIIFLGLILLITAFIFYFLRELSNYYYLHAQVKNMHFNLLSGIIGGGNITDLPMLAIILYTFNIDNSLLGLSYFDWLRNSIGVSFGMEPSSVGLIIYHMYVPESSGAPTPGAIGEVFANFNFISPFIMLLIGRGIRKMYNLVLSRKKAIIYFCYSVFLVTFMLMYPKVDSTMIVNFFWGVVPTLLVIFMYYIIYLIAIR